MNTENYLTPARSLRCNYLWYCILFITGLWSTNSVGQSSNYSYATTTSVALETLGSPVVLFGTQIDDSSSPLTNIGFTFNFCGTPYSQFSVSSNGLMTFSGIATTQYSNSTNGATPYPSIMPLFDDLYTADDGNVRYQLLGSAPNRKLVVEWNVNASFNATADMHFQVWLFETSNLVMMVYGTGTGMTASVGITSNGAANFNDVNTTTNTSSNAVVADNNTTWPGAGRAYIFTNSGSTETSYTYCTTPGVSLETLGAATTLLGTVLDDNSSPLTNIGFSFNFFGTAYTQFSVSSNGLMTFSGMASNQYQNSTAAAFPFPSIMALFDDLYTANDGNVRYQTSGTAPNRKLVVEWNVNTSFAATVDKHFQVWLFETSNLIIMVYGSGTSMPSSSVGITSNGVSNFNDINTSTHTNSTSSLQDANTVWPGTGRAYIFNLFPGPGSCSGIPDPQNTVSSINPACTGAGFTLSVSNNLTGITGLSYQWQSSSDGSFAGSPPAIVNLGTGVTQVVSQTSNTYYRCLVTCNVGGTGISTPLLVTMNTNPFPEEFTSATFPPGCWTQTGTIAYLTRDNSSAHGIGAGSAKYDNWTQGAGVTSDLVSPVFSSTPIGALLTFDYAYAYYTNGQTNDQLTILTSTDSGSSYTSLVNYQGGAANPLNTVSGGSASAFTPTSSQWGTLNLVLPTGTNRIIFRGLSDFGNNLYIDSITIDYYPPCTGTPVPGNTIMVLGNNPVCPLQGFSLAVQFPPANTGISYQWQSSDDGTFSGIPPHLTNLGTDSIQSSSQGTATYYRCIVTCNVDSGTSTPLLVTMNPNICSCANYCISRPNTGNDEEIFNVTVGTLNNTSTCADLGPGPGSIQRRYSDYRGYVNAPDLQPGSTVSFSIQVGTCNGTFSSGVAIFIDYNHNGSFADSAEKVAATSSTALLPYFFTGSFSIPLSALPGITAMRVINAQGFAGSAINPCMIFGFGETEDYCVNIPQCSGTPDGGTANAVAPSICNGNSTTINLTSTSTGQAGISFQWMQATTLAGPYANVVGGSGENTIAYTTPPLTQTTFYKCVVTCVNGNLSNESTVATVTVNNIVASISPGSGSFCGTSQILTASPNGGGQSYVWSTGSFSSSITIAVSGTYTVTVTSSGCSGSATAALSLYPTPGSPTATALPFVVCLSDSIKLTSSALLSYTMNTNCSASFIDISSTGTSVGIPNDDAQYNVTLPFAFHYYGTNYTNGRISNNGWFVFGNNTGGSGGFSNFCLPQPATAFNATNSNVLCVNWNDLYPVPTTSIKTQLVGSVFIIQWTNEDNFDHPGIGLITFQLQLEQTSNKITFVYQDVVYGSALIDYGADATVGLNFSSTSALQYSCNTASLTNGQCISFTPNMLSYAWTGPNGFTSSQQNPIISNAQFSDSGTYTVVITNPVTSCSASASTGAVSVVPCTASLFLKAFIQGYYDAPSGLMSPLLNILSVPNAAVTDCDTVTILLVSPDNLSIPAFSYTGVIHTNGTLTCNYPTAALGHRYYIVFKHRNTIESWSADSVLIQSVTNYDFTNALSKTYGNNMVEVNSGPGVWAFWTGDVSNGILVGQQDGIIESSDYSEMENAVFVVDGGYVPNDLTGDGIVESTDYSYMENNVFLVIGSAHP